MNFIDGKVSGMAQMEAQIANSKIMDLDGIRDFLLHNPEFVQQDEELLAAIATTRNNGNVVSLEELARNRLLKETRKAKSRFAQIVETARNNYESQIRVQEAIIAVLDAKNSEDLRDILAGHVAFSLAADACVLVLSDSPANSESMDRMGCIIERIVPIEHSVNIGASNNARTWLYGENAQYIRSEAMARIEFGKHRRLGMLAIASSDIDCFRQDMGQELITFFARVVERVLNRLEKESEI